MSDKNKLHCGIALLVIGLFMPLGIYPVVNSDLSEMTKTVLCGTLTFGFELMALPAIAIMGKENFDRIMKWAREKLGTLKPAGEVGKVRYYTGLVMIVLSWIPTYIMAYMPHWLPDNAPERLWVNLGADAVFLISLFVLGGDFWDKVRSLFVRDAKVVFPKKSTDK